MIAFFVAYFFASSVAIYFLLLAFRSMMKQANPKARMMSEQTIIAMISAVPRPPPESGPEADEAPIYALASEFANAKAKQSLIV